MNANSMDQDNNLELEQRRIKEPPKQKVVVTSKFIQKVVSKLELSYTLPKKQYATLYNAEEGTEQKKAYNNELTDSDSQEDWSLCGPDYIDGLGTIAPVWDGYPRAVPGWKPTSYIAGFLSNAEVQNVPCWVDPSEEYVRIYKEMIELKNKDSEVNRDSGTNSDQL